MEFLEFEEGGGEAFLYEKKSISVTFYMKKKPTVRYVFKYKNPDTLR